MANSNITKKALANAMKELVAQMPFEKITVADICTKATPHKCHNSHYTIGAE